MTDKILMEHGSGGIATSELINEIFAATFKSDVLNQMEDSAVVPGSGTICMTTDSFVVTPEEFPGGDIGRLCICGTVNDLLMRGAIPKYITCGFILKEGTDIELLKRVVKSLADTCDEAGVKVVAGDTKVIEGDEAGGILINTAGVGFIPDGIDIKAANSVPGDAIIVSGNVGDHHATILSQRMSIENNIRSDNAPLCEIVEALRANNIEVHTLRDVTRGGLATVLKELAEASNTVFEIESAKLPVSREVEDFARLLGLDPLYMGNEGKLVATVAQKDAKRAVEIIRECKYGENATAIGIVKAASEDEAPGSLIALTSVGGKRLLGVLTGEGLPRIC